MSQISNKLANIIKSNFHRDGYSCRRRRHYEPGESVSSIWSSRGVGDSARTTEGRRITNIATGTFTLLIGQASEKRFFSGRRRSRPSSRGSRASYLGRNLRTPSKNVFSLVLTALSLACVPILFTTSDTSAITLTIVEGTEDQKINIPPTAEGKFVASDVTTAKVVSDHAVGYTLTVSATALTDGTNTISTLDFGTSINADAFSSASNTQYNNKWGYLPATYYNGTTTITNNTNYFPAPIGNDNVATLDSTTAATPTGGTEYNVSVGARIDNTAIQGSYESIFTFAVVGKVTPYSITYNDPSGEATNMPAPNPLTGNVDENTGTVDLSSTVPTRDGYTFKGWCSVSTSDDSCSETTYNPDGGGTNLAFPIDLASSNNTYTIYAMWASSGGDTPACSTKISGITYMQDITSSNKTAVLNSMTQNTQYVLVDNRDNKSYCVAKLADGNIWMTQNLDLEIGGDGVAALTSENTDLTTSGSGIYATDYTTTNGVIKWTPSSTLTTLTGSPATITNFASGSPTNSVTGWKNDNNIPYMAEGDDHYVYTSGVADTSTLDTIYASADECTADHSAEECAHYHVGNYYNWTAAIASSSSSGIGSTRYAIADNSICPAGWRLPKGRAASDTATTREFGQLWYAAGITGSLTATSYATNGFLNIRQAPLFFARGGYVYDGTTFFNGANLGYWWSSSVGSTTYAYNAYFYGTTIVSASSGSRNYGWSVRCIVR